MAKRSLKPAAAPLDLVNVCDQLSHLVTMARSLRAAGLAIERDRIGDLSRGLAHASLVISGQLADKLQALLAQAEEARRG